MATAYQRDPAQPEWRVVFPARLTARTDFGGEWRYDWREQSPESGSGDLVDASPGRWGAAAGGGCYAVELNNVELEIPPALEDCPVVWLRFRSVVGGQPVYEFQSGQAPAPAAGVHARLDSAAAAGSEGAACHAWYEVEWDSFVNGWSAKADGRTGTLTDHPAVERNGVTATPVGTFVLLTPDESGAFYLFDRQAAGGGAITVQELDAVPTYAGVTTIVLDQGDGFRLSQPGAGSARFDIAPASTTDTGVVNLVAQEFAGQKTLRVPRCYNVGGTTYPGGGSMAIWATTNSPGLVVAGPPFMGAARQIEIRDTASVEEVTGSTIYRGYIGFGTSGGSGFGGGKLGFELSVGVLPSTGAGPANVSVARFVYDTGSFWEVSFGHANSVTLVNDAAGTRFNVGGLAGQTTTINYKKSDNTNGTLTFTGGILTGFS